MFNIPNEVVWVYIIQWGKQAVGSNTYEEMERIIEKYPKYFPWEHKYKSIPKEIHEAYRREKNPDRDKPIVCSGEGLLAQIKTSKVMKPSELNIEKFFKDLEDDYKKEQEKKDKNKVLWDKYYSKYDLEYRE